MEKTKRCPPARVERSEPVFPDPTFFGPIRKWLLSEILQYEAACAGKPPPSPLPPEFDVWLTAAQIRRRLSVSDMWLNRRSPKNRAQAAAAA
jgi:hypothetical protein